MGTDSSRGWNLQRVIELLGTALLIVVGFSKLPRWFLFVPAAYFLVILLAWVGPPAWQRSQGWRSIRSRLKKLRSRWPGFQTRVITFREFFIPAHGKSVEHLLKRMRIDSSIGMEEISARAAEMQQVRNLLALMDRLTFNVARDASTLPSSLSEARRVARDFEVLLGVVEFRGIVEVLRRLQPPPDSPYDERRVLCRVWPVRPQLPRVRSRSERRAW